MSEQSWEKIGVAAGDLQAKIFKGLLEAQGIPVVLSQEGAGRVFGLSVGLMGRGRYPGANPYGCAGPASSR